MLEKIKSTAAYLKANTTAKPKIGIVLGSGLGDFVKSLDKINVFPYQDIPEFPVSTVEGHAGNLVFASYQGVEVVIMQGRFHFYEGYTMEEVAFPVRVMKEMGVETLFITNAAGGLNPAQEIGDLMLITDHINLMGDNPLMGKNENALGPRFPDMLDTYDEDLIEQAESIKMEIPLHKGVYIGVSGPTFETPAEYKFMRIIGGDAVGMSTVPEVIAAQHMGMRIMAVSVITDLGVEGKIHKVSHQVVQEAAHQASIHLSYLLKEMIIKQ